MKPGIYTLSDEQYFAADGISNSALKWIAPPKTPRHFWAKHIAKLIPDEQTEAMRLGSLTHRCILQPDTMDGAFHVTPTEIEIERKRLAKLKSAKVVRDDGGEKVAVAWSGKLTECEEWMEKHSDREILSSAEAGAIQAMRDAVWAHPLASRILKNSEHERAAFAEDKGLLLKSRYDALPTSGNVIADVKTCEAADLVSVEKTVSKYGYWRQAGFYTKVAELLGLERTEFVFIFVEKTPPYAVAVYALDAAVIEAGRIVVNRDLAQLRCCRERNEWPGYSDELQTCGLPKYEMDKLNQELAA